MGVIKRSFGGSNGYRSDAINSNSNVPPSYGESSGPVISKREEEWFFHTCMILIYTVVNWPN